MIEPCADVIATLGEALVIIQRLSGPRGLALPGGHLEEDESLEECAVREFYEETGLRVALQRQLKTYSDPRRDPRGRKITTVFVGIASGVPRDEPGHTKVLLLPLTEIEARKDEFACDHYEILKEYMSTYPTA